MRPRRSPAPPPPEPTVSFTGRQTHSRAPVADGFDAGVAVCSPDPRRIGRDPSGLLDGDPHDPYAEIPDPDMWLDPEGD